MMKMNRRSELIPFARPSFTEEEERAVAEVLRSGWVSTAKKALELEHKFREKLECAHACAVNSATAGLHLAVKALDIGWDDRVVTTPFTFTSTAEVLRYEGAHPLFVDIDDRSFNIDPDAAEAALAGGTRSGEIKGILPVHIAGRLCDMEALMELREKYSVSLIEDSAHAFPVRSKLGWAGAIGDAGVFSFYATKPISTGEGGMVVTNRKDIADRVMNLRLHGIDRSVWDRYSAQKPAWEYDVIAPGYKYNLSDILAAVGIVQLKKADMFGARRREIARTYLRELAGEDYLILPEETEHHCWHLFILRIRLEKLTINRDEFLHKLSDANIGVSIHFRPLHLMSYYRSTYGLKPEDFPNALSVYQSCFSLPIYYGLTDEEVEYIIDTIKALGRKHGKRGAA